MMFEIRLIPKTPAEALSFVIMASDAQDALAKARRIWERHPEFDIAELWNGMKMLRQL